jgi:hypothetical protein
MSINKLPSTSKTAGKFSSIDHFLIHFTQDDLHHLASDSIHSDILFDTNLHNLIVPDVLTAIRLATIDTLINACTCTTNMVRIRILVDNIAFSWKDTNRDTLCIRNNNKFEDCLNLAVSSGTT